MKVNMTPNPLDVVTIHASQGDTEARQWEFELHNNGELIDTSEVTEQLFFKSYKGGTEQLLPENGSTPTTSPFLGDIRYPQGLLTDQEFTYRQSPTESDGLAKITDVKGNTIVWNQLIQNGNFESTSGWSSGGNRGTLSASNNELSYTITEIGTSTELNRIQRSASFTQNHIYLFMFDFYALRNGTMRGILGGSQNVRGRQISCVSGWNKYADILAANSTNTTAQGCFSAQTDYSVGEVVKWRNFMLIDLTMLNDSHITDYDSFRTYYPLDYYSYNQGSLLSFNGNGIKTVGKNLWDNSQLIRGVFNDADFNHGSSQVNTSIKWYGFADTTYTVSWGIPVKLTRLLIDGAYSIISDENVQTFTLTPTRDGYIGLSFRDNTSSTTEWNPNTTIQIEEGSSATSYEPYTSSTTNLPTLTYFPTGMKSVGTVYDELTPVKAITRIGAVDLGSLTWYYANGLFLARISDGAYTGSSVGSTNGKCALYEAKAVNPTSLADKQMTLGTSYAFANIGNVVIKDSSYSDTTAFKTAMNGVYLYYELATPTETSFTTASLVTENAEIPLSNEDGVLIGKCTEELSAEPGFHDAKIKLSDGDGTCYSNKLQLHVERKPS